MCEVRACGSDRSTPLIASFRLDGGFRLIDVSFCKAIWFLFLLVKTDVCIFGCRGWGNTLHLKKKIKPSGRLLVGPPPSQVVVFPGRQSFPERALNLKLATHQKWVLTTPYRFPWSKDQLVYTRHTMLFKLSNHNYSFILLLFLGQKKCLGSR